MKRTWLISDLHLGHENSWAKFKKQDGQPLRPFMSTDEMNEVMIARWNNVVQPEDRVYVIGDVVINRRYLPLITRLMGRKCLIMGNHDLFRIQDYLDAGFDKILGSHKLENYILCHIPVHPNSLPRWARANIHGHLHSNVLNDPRYINMSVEQLNFTPMEFTDVKKRIEENYIHFEGGGRVFNWAYTDQKIWQPEGLSHDGPD